MITLLQFDYEYNNKLLELTEFNWDGGVPSDYSKTRNQWTGYKYNNRPDTDEKDMDLQYQWWVSEIN